MPSYPSRIQPSFHIFPRGLLPNPRRFEKCLSLIEHRGRGERHLRRRSICLLDNLQQMRANSSNDVELIFSDLVG